ncbi:hypothetical protein BASA62_008588 [Batrachochytrium salamandrivorans]|nr:hypothetical protein BASA62_008588 [Batrachochytrium salamandrivorans]
MDMTWVPWTIFGLLSMGGIGVSLTTIRWLQHKQEYDNMVSTVLGVATGIALSLAALIPIDIYLVSSTSNIAIGAKQAWATPAVVLNITSAIEIIYYILFLAIAVICFGVLPFAHTYFDDMNNIEDLHSTPLHKATTATSSFLGILVLLMLIGAYLSLPPVTPTNLPWFNNLLIQTGFETGTLFVIGIMTFVGLVFMLTHGACGLSLFCMDLIRTPRDLKNIEVISRLNRVRSNIATIYHKYPGNAPERRMRVQDRHRLEALQNEARLLEECFESRRESVEDDEESTIDLQRPAEFAGGIFLSMLAFSLVVSIMATLIDRFMRSCGTSCSFLVTTFGTVTILDAVLYIALNMFPMDAIIVMLLAYYPVWSVIYMLKKHGVGVFGLSVYTLEPGASLPQSLVLSSGAAILCIPAWILLLTISAPQYTAFGAQTICGAVDATGNRNCSLTPKMLYSCQFTSPPDVCTPSVISTIVNRYMYTLPIFGVVFYYILWIFCIVACIGVVFAVRNPQKPQCDEENEGLIANSAVISRR